MRQAWLSLVLLGCVGSTTKDGDSTADDPGACGLAEASDSCPSCSEGPYTCAFDGVSATTESCGDCQARANLYAVLCDAGSTATADEITNGVVCAPTVCEVSYGCSCTPTCGPQIPSGGSSDAAEPCTPCATPEDPPGPCEWNGGACAFPE